MTTAMEAPKPRVEDSEHLVVAPRIARVINALADVVLDEPDPATDRDLARWHRLEQALAEARRQFVADGLTDHRHERRRMHVHWQRYLRHDAHSEHAANARSRVG